jgi:hypothetical protein
MKSSNMKERGIAGYLFSNRSVNPSHTPTLCILTGTKPPITDFQLPFFRWLYHFPFNFEAVGHRR